MVMTLDGSELTVETRPRWLGRAFGARPLRTKPGADVVAFPAKGFFGARFVGVAAGGADAFLACSDREQLLVQLEAAGFDTTWREHRVPYPPWPG
jgi:hypothetical protein